MLNSELGEYYLQMIGKCHHFHKMLIIHYHFFIELPSQRCVLLSEFITECIVDRGALLNRLSSHSRWTAVCYKLLELTSLHLNFVIHVCS